MPLLIDPCEESSQSERPKGRKFHLRVYTLAVGALQVYISTEVLALFASKPYSPPSAPSDKVIADMDLSAHLTNTCLQSAEEAEESVFLLSDLVERSFYEFSGRALDDFSQCQMDSIVDRIGQTVAETFRAGLDLPKHFAVT